METTCYEDGSSCILTETRHILREMCTMTWWRGLCLTCGSVPTGWAREKCGSANPVIIIHRGCCVPWVPGWGMGGGGTDQGVLGLPIWRSRLSAGW